MRMHMHMYMTCACCACECSSHAPIVLVLLQLVYCATCTAPRCSLHSSKGRPAWSPSMLLVAAVAAAVTPPLSAPCNSSRAHCCRASKRARCRSRHTLAATQVLAKLCGALSAVLSLHTLHSCCTIDASFLHHAITARWSATPRTSAGVECSTARCQRRACGRAARAAATSTS